MSSCCLCVQKHKKHENRSLWLYGRGQDELPSLIALGVYEQVRKWDADEIGAICKVATLLLDELRMSPSPL